MSDESNSDLSSLADLFAGSTDAGSLLGDGSLLGEGSPDTGDGHNADHKDGHNESAGTTAATAKDGTKTTDTAITSDGHNGKGRTSMRQSGTAPASRTSASATAASATSAPQQRRAIIIGSGPAGWTAALYLARAGFKPLVAAGALNPGGQLVNTSTVENYPGFPEGIQGPDLMDAMRKQAEKFGAEVTPHDVTQVTFSTASPVGVNDSVHSDHPNSERVTVSTLGDVTTVPMPDQAPVLEADSASSSLSDSLSHSPSGSSMTSSPDSSLKTVVLDSGAVYQAPVVIVTTGSSYRHLNVPGEKKYGGHGVSYCATCDGFFFKGKKIAVVGGGDSAFQDALFLTRFADVTLIHRREGFRASSILVERAKNNPKIHFRLDSTVAEITGDGKKVTGVTLLDTRDGSTSHLPLDGVFVAIGMDPNTAFLDGQLALDDRGYIRTDGGSTRTNIPGVFAAGDVADPVYQQAVSAAGMGCRAALDAQAYLDR